MLSGSATLLHPGAFPGGRAVATIALAAVLTDGHVVLRVARQAILFQLHFIRRPPGAGLAGELAVSAGEGEAGLLAMIELPQPPAVRGVTAGTLLAEVALVHIVLLVAVDTLLADLAVLARQMTLLAGHRDVQPDQREAREVVVESQMRTPALGRVALITAAAEGTQVHIARLVAAAAVAAELLRGNR